jgi:P-aminobenzoate N-oxygenase AurF
MLTSDVRSRIDRLSAVSLRRVIEPDVELPGEIGSGAVLPEQLLSTAGLDLDLTPAQVATLSREELASMTEANVRFEAALIAAFTARIATSMECVDPRVTYLFHEIGEETRHSRLFIRMLEQLDAKAKNPLHRPLLDRALLHAIIGRDVVVDVLVLGGEEMTDLQQKRASEHPETDPFVVQVSRYHRQEEARHVAFARMILPVDWAEASATDRFMVRHVVPLLMAYSFALLVHPGVYATVGLPRWATWRAANRTPERRALRHEAIRPVLRTLMETKIFRRGRIPIGWRRLCGVDRWGRPAD